MASLDERLDRLAHSNLQLCVEVAKQSEQIKATYERVDRIDSKIDKITEGTQHFALSTLQKVLVGFISTSSLTGGVFAVIKLLTG